MERRQDSLRYGKGLFDKLMPGGRGGGPKLNRQGKTTGPVEKLETHPADRRLEEPAPPRKPNPTFTRANTNDRLAKEREEFRRHMDNPDPRLETLLGLTKKRKGPKTTLSD